MSEGGPYASDVEPGRFSIRDFLTIVFKRRVLIVTTALSTFLIVMAFTLSLPRTYLASATLLVNRARAEVPLAPNDSAQLIVGLTEQDLNTEIEILRSRSLIEEVVRSLANEGGSERVEKGWLSHKIESIKARLGSPRLSATNYLVIELQEEIRISAIRRSNAIRISYLSENPEWSARVVGTLTERYLERRVGAFKSSQAVSFFEEQMGDAKTRLDQYENEIEAFVDGTSITIVRGPQGEDSLRASKALAMDRLAQIRSNLGDAEVNLQEQAEEVESLRVLLANEPERLATADRNSITAAAEEIEVALTTLRLRRDELLQDFKPDSRHVRDIDTQIRMAEERLGQANNESSGINRTESNPIYLQLRSELLIAETDLDGTRARVASLKEQVARNQFMLNELNDKSFELDGLRRNALAAEEDYLLYRKKHEEARISAAMDREKIINVAVAQPAQVPLRPVPRNLITKFFLAIAMGVLSGFGVAFGLEIYLDRSFTTGEELERKLGVLHIASIPDGEVIGY